MLFSGIAQAYHCPNCDLNYCNKIPTSFLPIAVTVLASAGLWGTLMASLVIVPILPYLLGFVLSLLAMFILFTALQKLTAPWSNTRLCPRCGQKLTSVGGGFIDGGLPNIHELLLYAMNISLPSLLCLLLL